MSLGKSKSLALLAATCLSGFLSLTGVRAEHGNDSPEETETKQSTNSAAIKPKPLKFLSLTYYFDSRSFNTLNILTNTNALPWGLNIFGFTDLHSTHHDAGHRFDLTRYFMEYRLRRPLNVAGFRGLGFEMEYNDLNGPGNSMLRLGLTYNHPLPSLPGTKNWLQWRILPFESDNTGSFAGLVYFLQFSKRVAIIGFADFNINKNAPNRWVAEAELSVKTNNTFDFVVEGRYNGFEHAAPGIDGLGVALGLKFKP